MKLDLQKKMWYPIFLLLFCLQIQAQLYWKSTGRADQIFTNAANWETAPGNGLNPSGQPPTALIDAVFPSTVSTQAINFNGGICRNLDLSALPAANIITITGNGTIAGNVTANGNLRLFINNLNFIGSGSKIIDFGNPPTATTVIATGVFSFLGNGSYSLESDLYSNQGLSFVFEENVNFIAAAKTLNVQNIFINRFNLATATCNVNFNNCSVTLHSFFIPTTSLLATADFNGSDFLFQEASLQGYGISATSRTINCNSITFSTEDAGFSRGDVGITTGTIFNVNTLFLNSKTINASVNPNSNAGGIIFNCATGVVLQKPITIYGGFGSVNPLTINTPSISSSTSCNGLSSILTGSEFPYPSNFLGNSYAPKGIVLNNTGAATIDLSSFVLQGSNFTGGAGFAAPNTSDLGGNTGTITFGLPVISNSYYWVGAGNNGLGGNWNTPENWALTSGGPAQLPTGCIPGPNDDVYFDENSFSTSNQLITAGVANSPRYARNIFWTDSANEGFLSGTSNVLIFGSVNFTGVSTQGITAPLLFFGTGTHTVQSMISTTSYKNTIEFKGSGNYTLQNELFSVGEIRHYQGGLSTNGQIVTARTFLSLYTNGVPRNLNIANSTINLTLNTTGGLSWILDTTNLTAFTATNSLINHTGNGFIAAEYISGALGTNLSPVIYNNISFSSSTSFSALSAYSTDVFFNDISAASDLVFVLNTNSNTLHLASGKNYIFDPFFQHTIANDIIIPNAGCSGLTSFRSSFSGSRFLLSVGSGLAPYVLQGIDIKDCNATARPISIVGGIDSGNNLNVTASSTTSGRDFYWKGNSGNWNDGSHWAINNPTDTYIGGGLPMVSNPGMCIPTQLDNVFFTNDFSTPSFSIPNQTVTLTSNASCKNMTWNSGQSPNFSGLAAANMNIYGSVILESSLTYAMLGLTYMRGNDLTVDSQLLNFNGATMACALSFVGSGRYDVRSDLTLNNSASNNEYNLSFLTGQLYTNGYTINARHVLANINTTNVFDIQNSTFNLSDRYDLNALRIFQTTNNAANFNATGSSFIATTPNSGAFFIGNSNIPVTYNNFISYSNDVAFLYVESNVLTANLVQFNSPVSRIFGNLTTNILQYGPSSVNTIQANSSIIVNQNLIAPGTPCNPVRIQSSSSLNANLSSVLCNFNLQFVDLANITATTCTAAQNTTVGVDINNSNINWTFLPSVSITPLGADEVLACTAYPYTISGTGFGLDPSITYLWSTGETTRDIIVNGPGTYSVTATYGPSCSLSDTIVLGITPGPSILPATIAVCETTTGLAIGEFTLTNANATILGALNPADYIISYHSSAADASANINPLSSPYISASGTIYVRVQDVVSTCISFETITLTVNPKPDTPTINIDAQPTCTISDGSFTITNYNPTFSYSVSPSTGVSISGSSITAPSGTYSVISTLGSCTSSTNVTINPQPITPVTPTVGTITQPTCSTLGSVVLSNLPTGSWTLTQSGTVSATISGSGATTTLSGLTAGTYTFTVDNGSCISSSSTSVIINSPPSGISQVGSTSTICGTGDYTISVEVSGTPPYTVTGTGTPGTWVGNVWTSDIILAGTNYNVSIQDFNACNTLIVSGMAPVCCLFEVTCPTFAPTTVACYANIPTETTLTEAQFEALGNADGLIGNNPCGVIEITASNAADPGCEGNVIRTYTVTEYADPNNNDVRDAGEDTVLNTQTCTQTFTIERADFTMPANASSTVACPADVVAPTVPVVTDNCGTILTPSAAVISTMPTCEGDVTYTYTFTDCEGNTHDWVYTYTIERADFTMPANASSTVACSVDVVAPTVPVVTDACGNAITPSSPVISTMPTCEGDVTYTYTFTDCEGNTHDWLYTYTIEIADFTMPANASSTVACLADVVAPTVPAVTDACGNTLTPSAPLVSATPACEGDVTYTYTFTDCEGNTHDWVYTYTIEVADFTMPANASSTVACSADVVAPTVPVVTDACGNAITPSAPVVSTMPTCEGDVTYTYTFTDCEGNTHDWVYTYTIDDNIAPTGTTPGDLTFQCIVDVPVADITTITDEADNCSGTVMVTVSDSNNGGSGCLGNPYIITRTYSLTDCVGNTTDLIQTITVEDDTNPVFVEALPSNLVLECTDVIPTAAVLTATDNCGVATVVYDEQRTDGSCQFNYTLTRTWTATDVCGNEITHVQIIDIQDTTPPVFTSELPSDTFADCDNIPLAPTMTATDSCGNVTITFNEQRIDGDCSSRSELIRTWIATDECGNSTTHTQSIKLACYVKIWNAVSPNDDGKNDSFLLEGIECYQNNSVEIFNRWGVKVFETNGYDNVSKVFSGYSDGRATLSRNELLPTGTYFYILKYEYSYDGLIGKQNIEKSGYLYIIN